MAGQDENKKSRLRAFARTRAKNYIYYLKTHIPQKTRFGVANPAQINSI